MKYGAPPKKEGSCDLAHTAGGLRLSMDANPASYEQCAENVLSLVVICISSVMCVRSDMDTAMDAWRACTRGKHESYSDVAAKEQHLWDQMRVSPA